MLIYLLKIVLITIPDCTFLEARFVLFIRKIHPFLCFDKFFFFDTLAEIKSKTSITKNEKFKIDMRLI